ncbi:MAG TPA: gluconate 2-dehydrogenase subunit 3 family protein [Pyrinomonadaceae bacterium]|nr:gluconate 2-dehydrogenase subunit 3 family protein [Pyrinomonadaceae bacterium]
MSDEKTNLSRRRALKIIGIGVGAAGGLSIYDNPVFGQHQDHSSVKGQTAKKAKGPQPLRFFTPAEMAVVTIISEMIIPADAHSPGAKEAEVPNFIDLMVSETPQETRSLWRDGLAAIEKMSQSKFSKAFADASTEQQIKLLTEVSENEFKPKTLEERFFVAIKTLTINGYYTSEIGIHQDLQYKGNTYQKEFQGCTHPEHQVH